MKYVPGIAVVVLLVALYILGHHEWHQGLVTIMNGVTSFFTGSK